MNNITEFNQLTGGLNIRLIDTLINTSQKDTEFSYLENFTTYQSGGLTSYKGIQKLITSVVDTTPIIAMAAFSSESDNMIVYQKASGGIRFISSSGGAEPTAIATGITAPCQFVQFGALIVGVNGVNMPFTCTPSTYAAVTTPHADWSGTVGKPNRVCIHNSTRVIMTRRNNIYISALGNPNDWTHPNDAFSLSGAFGDFTDIRAIHNYGEVTAFHAASNNVKLLTGATPDEYVLTPAEAPQSCQAPLGITNANRVNWYVSRRGIYAFGVNEFGKILFEKDTELTNKIRPLFQGEGGQYGSVSDLTDSLLVSNPNRNELVFLPKVDNETTYRGQFIFSFDNMTWEYKKTVPLSACCYAHGEVFVADGRESNALSGQLYRDNKTNSLEDSTAFTKRFSTGFINFGDSFSQKMLDHLYFRFTTSVTTELTLNFYANNKREIVHTRQISLAGSGSVYASSTYGDDAYSTSGYSEERFPLQFRFKTLKLEVICNNPITDFRLLSFGLELKRGDAR